jgi:hypothetical protein
MYRQAFFVSLVFGLSASLAPCTASAESVEARLSALEQQSRDNRVGLGGLRGELRDARKEARDLSAELGRLRADFLKRLVAIGRVKSCEDYSFWPPERIELTCERPGALRFSIKQANLNTAPAVILAPIAAWGEAHIEEPKANVYEVTTNEFLVRTTDGQDTRNVSFSFLLLGIER